MRMLRRGVQVVDARPFRTSRGGGPGANCRVVFGADGIMASVVND